MLALSLLLAILDAGPAEGVSRGAIAPASAEKLIADRARKAIALIQSHDWKGLAPLVHPVKGVCLSPYNGACEKGIPAAALADLWESGQKLTWGKYDGSGDAIRLSFKDYYRRFVCDRDFGAAKSVLYNVYVQRGGDHYDVLEDHPGDLVVDFHESAAHSDRNDWRSLRLVFEKSDDTWYLVAIVHDEWTI
jgi:hypothetical protein